MRTRTLRRELKKTLTEMKCEGDTAMILLASAFVGARSRAVAEVTGLPLAEVSKRAKNLKRAAIWLKSGKVDAAEWFNEEGSIEAISFSLHCLVADGMVKRVEASA